MDPHRLGLVSTRLHYFQLVARAGSIRQVARALNVAPSSISRVIVQLEEDLGTKLFERARQRLRLTSAGELLLYRARLSLGELSRACTEVGELLCPSTPRAFATIQDPTRGELLRIANAGDRDKIRQIR